MVLELAFSLSIHRSAIDLSYQLVLRGSFSCAVSKVKILNARPKSSHHIHRPRLRQRRASSVHPQRRRQTRKPWARRSTLPDPHFLMPVYAALAIALTACGIWFHLGRESTVSLSKIRVEAEGSKFNLSLSRPGRVIANKYWRYKHLIGVRSRHVSTPMTVSPKNRCRRKQPLHGYPSFHVSPLLKNDKMVVVQDLVTEISIHIAGSGLYQHPELASNVSRIAMFHELHCLVRLRSLSEALCM